MATTTKANKATEKAEAIQALRELLKPGDTVYTVCRHVNKSGMSRRLDFYCIRDGRLLYLSGWVGKAIDLRRHAREDGLIVRGTEMNMGFSCVRNLGSTLWGKMASEDDSAEATEVRKQLAELSYTKRSDIPDPSKPDRFWFGATGYALTHLYI